MITSEQPQGVVGHLPRHRRPQTGSADHRQVVLVAPPGETAILSPLDVGRLRAALRDAVVDASLTHEG
jgi:hypothetical protein